MTLKYLNNTYKYGFINNHRGYINILEPNPGKVLGKLVNGSKAWVGLHKYSSLDTWMIAAVKIFMHSIAVDSLSIRHNLSMCHKLTFAWLRCTWWVATIHAYQEHRSSTGRTKDNSGGHQQCEGTSVLQPKSTPRIGFIVNRVLDKVVFV